MGWNRLDSDTATTRDALTVEDTVVATVDEFGSLVVAKKWTSVGTGANRLAEVQFGG